MNDQNNGKLIKDNNSNNSANSANAIFNDYMGSKYSEFLFPEAIISDKHLYDNSINNMKYEKNKSDFLKIYTDVANKYIRPNNKAKISNEGKNSLGLEKYFNRANIIRKRRNLTNLTPDEIETFRLVKEVRNCFEYF